jgi:TolB protein
MHHHSRFPLACLLLGLLLLAGPAAARQPAPPQPAPPGAPPAVPSAVSADNPVLVIDGNKMSQVRLAFPKVDVDAALAADYLQAAREVEQTLRDDLAYTGIFNVQGPAELAVLSLNGDRAHDFEQYGSLGNKVVLLATLTKEGDRLVLDGWVYDLPSHQSVLGKRFRGTTDQARQIAHYLSDALFYQFTGRQGIALTTLAFQSDREGGQELFLMDYDGHNQRRISGHKSTSGYSDWSPTGDAIAYMSYFSGTPGIYYVDLASGNKVPIYREGVLNISPTFSPDGKKVAFASAGPDSNIDIYTCERACRTPIRMTNSPAIDTNPSWSPDGKQIAFTSSRAGKPQIFLMDADGQNTRRISFDGEYNEGASWRPDGQQIVYASRRGNRFDIAVTNLVDLQTRILTSGSDASYEEPCFAPDGQRIAFTSRRGKQSQVFVMNVDGKEWRQLTHDGNSSSPDWSPYPPK